MTTKDEALRLALEALEYAAEQIYCANNDDAIGRALAAIREALEQPQQEPVAWGHDAVIEDDEGRAIGTDEPDLAWGKSPPDDCGWWPLYTTPPRREWAGLTDDEVSAMHRAHLRTSQIDGYSIHGGHEFARAIEARLKEKNDS